MVSSSPTRPFFAFLVAVAAVTGFVLAPAAATVPVDDDTDVSADGDGGGNVSASTGDTSVSAGVDASTDDGVSADASVSTGDASLECSVDDADCDASGADGAGGAPGVEAPDASPERPGVDLSPDAPPALDPDPGLDRPDLPLGTLPADVYSGSVGTDDGPEADYDVQRVQVGEDGVWVVAGASAEATDDGPRAYGLGAARAGEGGVGYFGLASATAGDERSRVMSGGSTAPDERAGDGWATVERAGDRVTLSIDCDGERCQPRKDGIPGRGFPAVEYGDAPCTPWETAYEEYPDGPPGPTDPVFEEVPGTVVSPWNPPGPPLGYCSVYDPNDPAFNATRPPAPGDQEVDHAEGKRQVAEDGHAAWLVDYYSVDTGEEWPYAYGVSALRVTDDGRFGYYERVTVSDTEKNTGAESAGSVEPDREAGRVTVTTTVVDRNGGVDLDCDGETCELTFPGLPDDLDREFEYNGSSDDGDSSVDVGGVGESADAAFGASSDAGRSAPAPAARQVVAFPGFPSAFEMGLPGTGEAADALWRAVEAAEN